MRKISKFLIIIILLLAACNRPQAGTKTVPTKPVSTQPATLPPDTPVVSETQDAETTDIPPTAEPPLGPTPDLDQIISGDRIPLLQAGTEITLQEVNMVNENAGWGIGVSDSRDHHIFKTSDGGSTWSDITPPQPMVKNAGGLLNANMGTWDENIAWVAYGGAEYIWTTRDGGTTWQPAVVEFMTTYDGMFSVLDQDHVWFYQFLEGGMQKVFTALNRSSDGGATWELLLDPYTDATIQAFDKTGSSFVSPDFGWLTRDFRGVDPFVRINLTYDGGMIWDAIEIPAPPSLPDLFQQDLAGLYDPYLVSPDVGYFRLFARYFENETMIDRDFLYKTADGGASWEILEAPRGEIFYISGQVMFSISRDIYISEDGGVSWQLVRTVNWDGNFSFIDQNTSWAVAHDPDDDEYALVKTTDGCQTFTIIEPKLLAPGTTR